VSRTGRRSGTPDTREAILTAARRGFATRGYDATSLRGIATAAKVDPALVIHYFGTKEGLFVAATGLPAELPALIASIAALPEDDRVPALVRGYLHVVDSDKSRNAILALVRSAVSNDQAAAVLREFLAAELLPVIARLTSLRDARLSASLVAAQLMGIAMLRHVIKLDSLARASPDDIVALVTPAIDQYLRPPARPALPRRHGQTAQRPADARDPLAVPLDRGVGLEERGRDAGQPERGQGPLADGDRPGRPGLHRRVATWPRCSACTPPGGPE
jgi:AcrR family transcriptional regulator